MTAEPAARMCRDCFAKGFGPAERCPRCRSARIVAHGRLFDLSIAHIDCDAFYASVEKRDRPELSDRPVLVGGGRRGVVSAACYIARTYGVHSAMPMFRALKACPDAAVIRPDFEKYSAVARAIREKMLALTPAMQPISIDEAFLDLSGTERVHKAPPAISLARLAAEIERDIGVTVSVGLSANKFLAKIASDFEKPRGFSVICREEAPAFLADKPVSFIWGVGAKTQSRLAVDGYKTIGDLQAADRDRLIARYGALGARLAKLAFGEDARAVNPHSESKSISCETTFDRDLSRYEDLRKALWRLSEKVSARAKRSGLGGRVVTIKLKRTNFKSLTRRRVLRDPTRLAAAIFETADRLLKAEAAGEAYRLIGVGISELYPAADCDPLDLADPRRKRLADAERAIDAIREKHGRNAIRVERG